jgi:hypothetical protein
MADMRVRAKGIVIGAREAGFAGPAGAALAGGLRAGVHGGGGPAFARGWRVGVRGAPHVWKHSVIAERRSRESPTLEPL